MNRRHSIVIVGVLALALGAWAQDSTPTSEVPQGTAQEPIPAYGQENAPPPILENPPITGLDTPGLEPHGAPVSYIQPGVTVNQSADSNVGNLPGAQSVRSVSRALGSIVLHRLWSHYDLALDYVGGAGYYNLKGVGWKALQEGDIDQKITWKRGQLSLRDSFSYLPDGNFGGAYGSLGSQGIASLEGTSFGSLASGASFAALGDVPRLINVSMVDISENLTPKSAITAAGGYAIAHFYGNDLSGAPLVNSSEISAQAGYDRVLTPHTQVALAYAYQGFDFSTFGNAFHTHVIQAMYGHRLSGRMDVLIGAGPQITFLTICPPMVFIGGKCLVPETSDQKLGVAGEARLRYKFPRTSLDLMYQRYVTSGSGLFAGAQSDVARLSLERPLTRVWSASTDVGYSRSQRLQAGSNGFPGTTFYSGFAGLALHRAFGHNFHAFASYQFNELLFTQSFCGSSSECNRISNRHVGTVGLDWTPRPMRID